MLVSFACCPASYADIKIGTLYFDPPFVYSLNQGFDIDLSRVICKHLQETCEFIPMNFVNIFPALNQGKIDIAIGGLPIPSPPDIDYIYSLPYLLNQGQFMVLKDSNINSVDQLKGATVGVVRGKSTGSVFSSYLTETYSNAFQLKQYDDMEDVITALTNKKVSASFMHRSTVNYWVQNAGEQFKPMGKIVIIGNGIAILATPKQNQLIEKINTILQVIEKDGTYLKLYNTYFPDEL